MFIAAILRSLVMCAEILMKFLLQKLLERKSPRAIFSNHYSQSYTQFCKHIVEMYLQGLTNHFIGELTT